MGSRMTILLYVILYIYASDWFRGRW